MAADITEGHVRCIRLFAQSVRKSAKFLSSQVQIVQFIAKTATQSVRTKAVKRGANRRKTHRFIVYSFYRIRSISK